MPTQLGKYEVLEQIGAGGYGVVYKGYDPFIRRLVAIKTCSIEDERVRLRFYREAEIAGNLIHPNVTTVYDFGLHEGVPYLVEEYLTGEDLDDLIARREPLTVARKLDYLVQVARGLEYAHSQGVVHRDIKPGNIRVLDNGRAKIMDFGTAKLAHVESHLTQAGMTLGTAAYISPEQIQGSDVGLNADIFSYGVTAYELLAYVRPFDGRRISAVLHQILHDPPQPIVRLWPDCPQRLEQILVRCLEKLPAKRYARTADLVADLQEVVHEFSSRSGELAAVQSTVILGAGEAEALLERARDLQESHELDRAMLAAGEALAAAPASSEASLLFRTVESDLRAEIEQERRRVRLQEITSSIAATIDADELTRAGASIADAEREHGPSDALGRLRLRLDEASRRRRAARAAPLLERAELAMDRGDYPAAKQAAGEALAVDAENEIARATLAAVDRLLERDHSGRRQQAEADAVASIEAYLDRGRVGEGRAALAFAVSRLGHFADEARLHERIEATERRLVERQELTAKADEARDLLLVDAYAEALELLLEVQRRDASYPSIDALVRSAQEASARQAETRRRAQAVTEAVVAIEGYIKRHELTRAEEALQFALDRLGSFDEARRLLRVIASERDRERRVAEAAGRADTQARMERARRLMASEEYGAAVNLLRQALEADPESVEVETLLVQAKEGRTRQAAAERQAQAVEEAVAGIESYLRRGDVDQARAALTFASQRLGETPALAALRLRLARL